ncbi:MAG: AAA family ATPase, partial [Bacteroidales bacterium]|nr:AAA family ATPase [Bacteroidales bacterium]
SFREYLHMTGVLDLQAITFNEVIENHSEIASEITSKFPVLKHFKNYLKKGFYPYFLEAHRDYLTTLQQIIRTIIESDLRFIENFDVAKSQKMLTLLRILAASSPFKPNISKISEKIGLHRHTVLQYLQYLEKAKLIRLLNQTNKYISRLQKPDKVFLDNPNLFYALNPEMINIGSLRETFALNQLSVMHPVFLHNKADFIVDNKHIIEIGGKNKDFHQINQLENALLFVDDIEIGYKNRIPLWLLGLLY